MVTGLVIMLTATVSIAVVAVAVRNVLLDDLRNYLRRTAETTAALIDGERHARLTDSSDTGTAEYDALAAPLVSLLRVNPDIRFAYTGMLRGDTALYVLDGDLGPDRAYVTEPDAPTPGERTVVQARETVVERHPSPTAWGNGIRAYAPIRTPPGTPVAYVGITMNADRHAAWLRRVYDTTVMGFVVAAVLAVVGGVRAGRRERAREEAQAAADAARAHADVAAEERRALELRLEQKHRTEALGTLAGGVAHDFNNLLAVILGNAELILRDVAADSIAGESAQAIQAAAGRARDVTRRILLFARPGTEVPGVISLGLVVDETVRLLSSTLPPSIAINWELPETDVTAFADSSQVTQVLMNLGVNASQALAGRRGHITFSLDEVHVAGSDATRLGVDPGVYARLRVSDDGVGMSEDVRGRIFEPFFTTRKIGEGSGLGLSVVDGVVRAHRGAIEVHSVVGDGATFVVLLPSSGALPGRGAIAPSAGSTGALVRSGVPDPCVQSAGAPAAGASPWRGTAHPFPLSGVGPPL